MADKTGSDYPQLHGRTLLGVPVEDLPMDDATAEMLQDGFDRMDDLDRVTRSMMFGGLAATDGPVTVSWRRWKNLPLVSEVEE